ncbi:hypothetical protein PEDI_29390 [Persicobacter diffluens]|uniref:Uncharacterized protein n=1 Tax=Persicobacter diffluens TaxID=981 RepID=A0AAN4W142_9BACT|nr:hypothetical protein PEDI_29390 [Persicobacter diffluens]
MNWWMNLQGRGAEDLASGKYQMEALIEFLKDKLGHWRA